MSVVAVVVSLTAAVLAALRWLRVAQREHYLPGSVVRFAGRWWFGLGFNRILAAGALVNLLLALVSPFFAILGSLALMVGPFGLRLRGRAPGPMRWTRRLRTLAAVTGGLIVAVVAVGALFDAAPFAAYIAALAAPGLVDAALLITKPLEARLARPWIERAQTQLRSVNPMVLAITGSYGKTSTKGYVAHLIQGTRAVVATPASFNNALGLARAINENLAPGTEVFVAEMGTYGPGEIAAMVAWAPPSAAAITAIGPVHLERMKSEDTIAAAKSEILGPAGIAVLNVDDARLARIADDAEGAGKRTIRCSGIDRGADVAVIAEGDELVVLRSGTEIARMPSEGRPATNIAIAVALAGVAGVPDELIARRLPTIPTARNRRALETAESGALYIDDSYNSNPAGAHAALELLAREAAARDATTIALVTPGMVELGPRQPEENERFASAAARVCTDIVLIGSTNRAALRKGAEAGSARVVLVEDRAEARAWVQANAHAGAVVLFENDLPDHFP